MTDYKCYKCGQPIDDIDLDHNSSAPCHIFCPECPPQAASACDEGLGATAPTRSRATWPLGATGSVSSSVLGITLEDIRKAAIEIPTLPKTKIVRVSDEWWIWLEDGVPTKSISASMIDKLLDALPRAGQAVAPNDGADLPRK